MPSYPSTSRLSVVRKTEWKAGVASVGTPTARFTTPPSRYTGPEGVPERAAEAGEAFGAEAVMDDDPPPEGTLMSGTGYEPPEFVVPVTLVPPFANVYPSA